MVTPTFADYTDLLLNLFARFWQHACAHPHRGHPFVYTHKALLVFFLVMQQRRTFRFKAQRRWLLGHPELRQSFGWPEVPDRTTLSRRSNPRSRSQVEPYDFCVHGQEVTQKEVLFLDLE